MPLGRDETSAALLDPNAIAAEKMRRRFPEFVKNAWQVIEPDPLLWGWHMDAICQHLQAVAEGRIQRLAINIAPGMAKSLITSVLWPAWLWLRDPTLRLLTGSYDMGLATRDCMRSRDVLTSDWFRDTFTPTWSLRTDQDTKTWYENDAGGARMAVSVGGRVTGFRADVITVDDPHNVEDSYKPEALERARVWWQVKMGTRLNPRSTIGRVVIQQRVAEDDLTGQLVARAKGQPYEVLSLPTEFDPDRACATSIGWKDPRTVFGELLFEAMIDAEKVAEFKEELGPYHWSAQHQQQPMPSGAGIIKPWWVQYHYMPNGHAPHPVQVRDEHGALCEAKQRTTPGRFDLLWTTWDLTFKNTAGSDLVSGQAWGRLDANVYLLDAVNARMDFAETVTAVRAFAAKWKRAATHLVEDAANGPAVVSSLRSEIQGLVAVTPRELGGGKEARGHAAAPTWASGHVWIPHPDQCAWVDAWREEVVRFPNARHDDQFDAMTMAIVWQKQRRFTPSLAIGGGGAGASEFLTTS